MRWRLVAFGHNEQECGKTKVMAEDLGTGFYVEPFWGDRFSPERDPAAVRHYTKGHASGKTEFIDIHVEAYLQKILCSQLWNIPQINRDGRILGFCVNLWLDFGNSL
ncbi:MAG: hypothetical protein OEQ18_12535 [Gammaproteobacteria bacterium]|nr:hypothetical protein [Gammaproteobacteria bacterium]